MKAAAPASKSASPAELRSRPPAAELPSRPHAAELRSRPPAAEFASKPEPKLDHGGKLDPKLDKAEWEASFAADPIDLHDLPTPKLVLRAREILEAIGRGAPWHQFNGKRLQHDRTIISVPLGRRYRLLFRTDAGSPQPVEVLSHEAYNATKPGRR